MVPRLLFIVPAFNEEGAIGRVVAELRRIFPEATVLVIDDGSLDATAAIASLSGARVLQLPVNLGIGGAVQTGLLFASRYGYDAAVQVDGDGQHPADQVARLLEPIIAGRADAVIGSRFLATGYRAPMLRRIGIAIFNGVNTAILRRRVSDATSGFRAYNREAITFLASTYADDYPEPESILVLARQGLRIEEVSVDMRARSSGRSSITLLRSIYYMLKVLLAILVNASRRVLPRDEGEVEHESAGTDHRHHRERARRAAGI